MRNSDAGQPAGAPVVADVRTGATVLEDDDEFDLDVRISPGWFATPMEIGASGTCGGCPEWTEEGSSCQFSCQDSCGGGCSYNPVCGD